MIRFGLAMDSLRCGIGGDLFGVLLVFLIGVVLFCMGLDRCGGIVCWNMAYLLLLFVVWKVLLCFIVE